MKNFYFFAIFSPCYFFPSINFMCFAFFQCEEIMFRIFIDLYRQAIQIAQVSDLENVRISQTRNYIRTISAVETVSCSDSSLNYLDELSIAY